MLLFLPPIVSAVIGVALLGAGVAVHSVILGAIGCVGIAVGSYRWLRKRRDEAAE